MQTQPLPNQAHRISAGVIVQNEQKLLLVHHVIPGRYDFWVCPGGGVQADESLEAAAKREVMEESGLDVAVERLVYIEELLNPEMRIVKFWFLGASQGGALNVAHPAARSEHITEAQWIAPEDLRDEQVFPAFLLERFRADQAAGFPQVVRLPLRAMGVW
jgi:ADP-ribose pyrophosphatase YjhB (NUDIX family)